MIELLIIALLFIAISAVIDYKIMKTDNRKDRNGHWWYFK